MDVRGSSAARRGAGLSVDYIDDKTVPSAAAARMRRCRERRREGMRCLTIELRETEIDALIRRGLLKPETRNIRRDIVLALYVFLDRTLGRMP
jgi:hypothetical protein